MCGSRHGGRPASRRPPALHPEGSGPGRPRNPASLPPEASRPRDSQVGTTLRRPRGSGRCSGFAPVIKASLLVCAGAPPAAREPACRPDASLSPRPTPQTSGPVDPRPRFTLRLRSACLPPSRRQPSWSSWSEPLSPAPPAPVVAKRLTCLGLSLRKRRGVFLK